MREDRVNIREIADKTPLFPLFKGWDETMIWSCLQGCMGSAYGNHLEKPTSAKIHIGDFCFFAGAVDEDLLRFWPEGREPEFLILVPQNEEWEQMIEAVFPLARRRTRYATKKEPHIFDGQELWKMAERLPKGYELRKIDENLYGQIKESSWAGDLCSQFQSWEDYKRRGLGVAAVKDGQIASGASSYTVYNGGIEIEVDTREDERRKGLALSCCAKLMIECLNRGLYPSWDAQNKGSLALAQKLGYRFDKEYPVYERIIIMEG